MHDLIASLRSALAGRYRVEDEVGRGGMAVVLRAWDERHERWVAMKVLRPDLTSSLGGERFLREIRLAAGLQHPHILPVHDSGEAAGYLFYVMPFVEGESLRQRLDREGQLPLEDALRITREVAGALQYAHDRDIVHRDIKPENILLSGDHALVADFGIARAITAASGLKLTETGIAVGTPAYMAPEQITGDARVDGRADVYALGSVLYELLAGKPPFEGSAHLVMALHATTPAPSVRAARPTVPPAVEAALATAMAKAPADRFASAAAFALALPTLTAAHPTPPRPRARTWALATVASLLLIGLVWAGTLIAERPPETISIAVAPMRVQQGTATDTVFADALTQELTAALTRVERIAPRPYGTVAAAAVGIADPVALGRRVDVDYVLESTLRRRGDRLRILSVLIRVDNGTVAWSPTAFEGYDTDLSRMQDSIATKLIRDLAGSSVLGGMGGQTRRTAPDPEAYKLYLAARHQPLLSVEGSAEAVRLYRAATERDPQFAEAWVGLGHAYGYWSQHSGEPPGALMANWHAAINRALAIDSLNGEAWVQRAFISQVSDWDFERADAEYARGVTLTPNAAWPHIEYAKFLYFIQRRDSAYAELRRARALDPSNVHFLAIEGYFLQADGRVVEADSTLRHALALEPRDFLVHFMRAKTALRAGRPQEALRHMLATQEITGESPFMLGPLAHFQRMAGQTEEARTTVSRLRAMTSRRYVQRAALGIALFGAGDSDAALTEMEASASLREVDLQVGLLLMAAELWREPRYQALVRRVGLHRYWTVLPAQ